MTIAAHLPRTDVCEGKYVYTIDQHSNISNLVKGCANSSCIGNVILFPCSLYGLLPVIEGNENIYIWFGSKLYVLKK